MPPRANGTSFRELLAIAIIIIISELIFFHQAIISDKVILPLDILKVYYPWRYHQQPLPGQEINLILFDEVLEFLPWRHFAAKSLSSGIIPLWNPYNFCGSPFVGVLQSGIFYPLNWLLFCFDDLLMPNLSAFIHTFLAGIFMFVFCRYWGISFAASSISSLAWCYSGFLILWLGHPHSKVACYTPLLFLLGDKLIIRGRLLSSLLLSLAVALNIVIGHAETTMHIITALFVYVIFQGLFNADRAGIIGEIPQKLILFVGSVITGALLSSLQVLPFLEYLYKSTAYMVRSEAVVTWKYFPLELAVAYLVPKFFGSDADGNFYYAEFNSLEIGSLYVGIAVLVFASWGILNQPGKKNKPAIIAVLAVSIAIVFGLPGAFQVTQSISLYRMSYNFRMGLTAGFALIVLAAYGMDHALSYRHRSISWLSRLLIVGAIFIGAYLYVLRLFHRYSAQGISNRMVDYIQQHIYISAAFFMLTLLLLTATVIIRSKDKSFFKPVIIILLLLVVFGDLYIFGERLNPYCDARLLSKTPASAQFLVADPEPFRIFPLHFVYPPHLTMLYGIEDVRGNDALTPYWQEQYLALVDPSLLDPKLLPALRQITLNAFNSPLVDVINCKYVLHPPNFAPMSLPGYRLVFDGEVKIYLNIDYFERFKPYGAYDFISSQAEALDIIKVEPHAAKKVLYLAPIRHHSALEKVYDKALDPKPPTASRQPTIRLLQHLAHGSLLESDADKPFGLLISVCSFEGWNAYVDGKKAPVFIAQGAFQGMIVPPGEHLIEHRYQPMTFMLGLYLSLLSWVFILVSFTLALMQAHQR